MLRWKMVVYFMTVWSILLPFGIFGGHLVYFWSFGTFFSVLVFWYREKSGNPDCGDYFNQVPDWPKRLPHGRKSFRVLSWSRRDVVTQVRWTLVRLLGRTYVPTYVPMYLCTLMVFSIFIQLRIIHKKVSEPTLTSSKAWATRFEQKVRLVAQWAKHLPQEYKT
jgi:hypothetical protein